MTSKEKLALLEELLEVEKGTLREDTELKNLLEWDSLAGIAVMAMFDEEFDKIITSDQVKSFVTVKDIMDLME